MTSIVLNRLTYLFFIIDLFTHWANYWEFIMCQHNGGCWIYKCETVIQDGNPLELPMYWIINMQANFSKFQLVVKLIVESEKWERKERLFSVEWPQTLRKSHLSWDLEDKKKLVLQRTSRRLLLSWKNTGKASRRGGRGKTGWGEPGMRWGWSKR